MKKSYLIGLALLIVAPMAIEAKKSDLGAYQNIPTECMNVELDGSQTLRVYGKGRNRTDAIEQAKKNAVYDVLFNGIKSGNGGCNTQPLLLEVNAKEKYEYYFNVFFKDRGEYLKYISMEDQRILSKKWGYRKEQMYYGITVRVLRPELKQRLIDDGIIKP